MITTTDSRHAGLMELWNGPEALGFGNLDIEVEYQGDTIGRYGPN